MQSISKNREEPRDVVKSLLGQIHMAKKDLKLSEDEYRGMLAGLTGKESCASMDIAELSKVLDAMRSRGWKPKVKATPSRRRRFDPKENSAGKRKIFKLWYLLADADKVSRSIKAMNAFIDRQTGFKGGIDWVSTHEAEVQVIEALKEICKREGVKLR